MTPGDMCPDCGHEGYDGHDMRSLPPVCMEPGCRCGQDPLISAAEIRDAIQERAPGLPVECYQTGGGTATLYVGTPHAGAEGDSRYTATVGPGSYDWNAPWSSVFYPEDLSVGRDDDGQSPSFYGTTAGAIADAVLVILLAEGLQP